MTNFIQSFLIVTKDKSLASSHTEIILKEKEVDSLDINLQTYEKSMGIEDVRNIQKSIFLKPFRSKTKAVIVQAYENITTEAQNAMLKILEEPPANTLIIISIPKKELLLPTVLSRCKIIELGEEKAATTDPDISNFNDILSTIFNGNISAKLKIAQNVAKDAEGVSSWLEKISIFAGTKLAENYNNPKYLKLLRQFQQTYKNIKHTNVNKRIALENLLLYF